MLENKNNVSFNEQTTNDQKIQKTDPIKPNNLTALDKKTNLLKIMIFVQIATHILIIIFSIAVFSLHVILFIKGEILTNENIINVYIGLLVALVIVCLVALGINIYDGLVILQTDWKNEELNRQKQFLGLATLFFVGAIATFMFYNAIIKQKKHPVKPNNFKNYV